MTSDLPQWIDIIRNHVSQEDESKQHKLFHPNAERFHPNAERFHPNAERFHPNAMCFHPNAERIYLKRGQ